MAEPDQPAPNPAEPTLASNLLELEEKQRKRFARRGEKISTACTAVDEYVLEGALERGIVLGISAGGLEGRLLSLNLIASVLLAHKGLSSKSKSKAKAAIVDTTGSFPISLLAKVIRSRIFLARRDPVLSDVTAKNSALAKYDQTDDEDVEKEVQMYLEMVTISRVFDVEGLWEVLDEVNRDSHSQLQLRDDGEVDGPEVLDKASSPIAKDVMGDKEEMTVKEIFDSEDEGLTSDEDYIAFTDQPMEQDDEGIEILVVDSMTDIVNELFARKEKNEAHNQLGTFSNIIHNLSSQSNILTILHNSTVSSKYLYPSNIDADPLSRYQHQNLSISLSSVFNSNPLKPALGRIFDQFPSLHLMLSSMPKTREDAEIMYGQAPSRSHIEYCTILEVLKDETPNLGEGRLTRIFGDREQRWVALVVSDDGLSLKEAFLEKKKGVA